MTSPLEAAQLFDIEHLQQLSYERSKTWAKFLDTIAEPEIFCEIPIDQVDAHFEQTSEDEMGDDDLASMEDDNCDDNSVDSDVLRDITNTTRLASLMFSGTVNNKATTILSEAKATNEENTDLIDLLNQTLPVINEHNRQMKESGFDRILNTFDVKKIEEKVGGWLRIHNSLCVNDYDMKATTPTNKMREMNHHTKKHKDIECLHRTPPYRATKPYMSCHPEAESDSDDSFHSGETARYIRSSRAGAFKNTSSSTTMIKTYRMVKSTRQELREKYACDQDDDADSHLAELKHRRRLAKELAMRHCNERHISGRSHKAPLYKYMTPSRSIHSPRRKILRKRTSSNSCSAIESSSESDSYYYDESVNYYHRKHATCCNQRQSARYAPPSSTTPSSVTASVKRTQHRTLQNMPCSRNDRMYYYIQSTHSHSKSPSSSPNTFSRTSSKRRLKRLEHHPYDARPCRRESECRCCNDKRLCKEYKHLADTSTEEWFVDNCFSPRKPEFAAQTTDSMAVETDNEPKGTNQNFIEKLPTKQPTKQPTTQPTAIYSEVEDDEPLPPKKARKKQETKPKNTKKNDRFKEDQLHQEPTDDSFESELQMALKLSKEQFEQEQKDKEKARQQKLIPMSNDDSNQLQTMTSEGKEQIDVRFADSSLNGPTYNRNNATFAETEETFLNFSKPMYNSTTVDNNKTEFNKSTVSKNNDSAFLYSCVTEKNTSRTRRKQKTGKVQTKPLQKEDCKQSKEDFKQRNDDHVFAKPQARPNVAVTTKNVANVGTETTVFKMPQSICNTTVKIGQQRQQISEDQQVFCKDKTIQKKKPKIAVTTKNVSNVHTEMSFFAVPSNPISNLKCTEQHTNNINDENKNSEKTTKGKIKKNASQSAVKTVSFTDSNKNINLIEELNVIVNEGNSNCSTKDSSKMIKENDELKEIRLKSSLGNFEGTNKTKNDLERSSSTNTFKTKNREKIEKREEFKNEGKTINDTENDSNEIELIEKESLLKHANGTKKIGSDQSRNCSIDISEKKQETSRNKADQKEEFANKNNEITKKTKSTKVTKVKQKKNNTSNVTSTSAMHSPEIYSPVKRSQMRIYQRIVLDDSTSDDNDCTVVTSTTNLDALPDLSINETKPCRTVKAALFSSSSTHSRSVITKAPSSANDNRQNKTLPSHFQHTTKGILIYAPQNTSAAPAHSFSNDGGFFNITLEHLSTVIGQKPAEKFLKYYIGRRRFNSSSTVYFRPPMSGVQDINHASSSDSDEDDLECIGQYGDLYESFGSGGGALR